jgi:hypothetical protein
MDTETETSDTPVLTQGDGHLGMYGWRWAGDCAVKGSLPSLFSGNPLDENQHVENVKVPEKTSAIKVDSVPGDVSQNADNSRTVHDEPVTGKRKRHHKGYYRNLTKHNL